MKPRKDIYELDKRLVSMKEAIKNSAIPEKNKELILSFEKVCALENLSKARRTRIMQLLRLFCEKYLVGKEFDKVNKDDLKDAILNLESDNLSPWTIHTYKAVLKKFFKWLYYGDNYKDKFGYPEIISWLKCSIKPQEKPKVKASEILTEEEIDKLIKAAEHPRDKAFISMLYELGARISEIGNLKIKDITRDEYGYLVDLSGKTGHRTPRIIESDPYLTTWLNTHPNREDGEAPLWVITVGKNKGKKMNYSSFRALIRRLARKAGIKKRIYPHLFRHTRVTHLLLKKQINEAQAKVYFGWTPSSKMLAEYAHLVSRDVNDVMLQIHGIKTDKKEEKPRIKQCPRCKKINGKDDLFCRYCGSPLDVKTAIRLDEKRNTADEMMLKLLKELLSEKEIKTLIARKIVEGKLGKLQREYFVD